MKMIITSVLILALLAISCIGSAVYVTNSVTKTASILDKALSAADQDVSGVLPTVLAAAAQWDSCATVFGTVLQHDEVDNVVEEFARLEYFAKTDDQEEFLSTCAALLAKLNHIREMELPTLKNIL